MIDDKTPNWEADIQLGLSEIRKFRALEWKEKWCKENGCYCTTPSGSKIPDIGAAPEPSDADLHWPEEMVSVCWDTGYTTMTVAEFQKLPKTKQKMISKLGGL